MKGVILCGGTGSRLAPLTLVTNKHLLPVYNKPMLYYPIEMLVKSGVRDILLVCGGNAAGEYLRIFGNGEQFGLKHLHYTYQSEPRGIADALGLAEQWADNQPITVLLGDNIFEDTFASTVQEFEANPVGAVIFGARVEHPEQYGVVEEDEHGNVLKVIEKPKDPKSNLIATGLYMYDNTVWDFVRQLTPSARGELEITDVNNHYLQKGQLKLVKLAGWWADCGENFDSLLDSSIKVREFCRKRADETTN
jgi:glucose-1-phosphate thymidylyltransferase